MNLKSVKMPNLKIDISKLSKLAKANSPAILTICGVSGVIIFGVLIAQATPKAINEVKIAEKRKGAQLTKFEMVKAGAKPYIPAALVGGATIGCIIGSNHESSKQLAASAAATAMAETTLNHYKNKVVELTSEEKERDIRNESVVESVKELQTNETKNPDAVSTGHGDVLCKEYMTGRMFYSDPEYLRKCENDLRDIMHREGKVKLAEWLELIGLTSCGVAYEYVWDLDYTGSFELEFYGDLDERNNQPILLVDYVTRPITNVLIS
jgi:hypothetical protein